MAGTVVIEFIGDPSGLKPLTDSLRALGQLTEQQEQALNDAAKAYENLGKSTKATTSEADKLNKAFQEFQEGIIGGATAEFSKQMAGLGMEVTKTTEKSKTMVGQLREMKQELGKLPEGSKEFEKLAIKAAKLEDKIGDINKRIRTLASDSFKLDALVSAVRGLAGGFAVAQGAAALFGKENEDVQKALLKVNAAMAILQGLQEVSNVLQKESAASLAVQTAAQKVYTFVTNGATLATRAFNAALVGLGIGAAIAALVAIVTYWEDIAKWIGIANDNQRKFKEITTQDVIAQREAAENGVNALQRQIELKKAQGATAQEIFELEQERRRQELATLEIVAILEKNNLKVREDIKDKKNEIEVAETEFIRRQADLRFKYNKEQQDKITEYQKQKWEERKEQLKIEADKLIEQAKDLVKEGETIDPIEIPIEIKTTTTSGASVPAQLSRFSDEEKELIKTETIAFAQELSDTISSITQSRRDAELEAELSALDAQRERELSTKDLTESQRAAIEAKYKRKEAKIKEDAFKAQQKADISAAIINAALGVTKTFAQLGFTPAGIAAAAALGATTALQIAVIKAQPIPKFRKGTKNAPEGVAMVGEEGHEIVAHDGQMSVVGKGLTYLPKGAKVIPHPESLKILQGHPDTVEIMKDYDIKQATGTHGIDVGSLGKAIGNELRKNQRVTVNIDEHGFNIFVEKGNLRRNYLNKMFGEQ